MRKVLLLSLVFLCISPFAYSTEKPQQEMPFNIYTDANHKDNHFIPSGWMGDYRAMSINTSYAKNPANGYTCIKITYSGEMPQGAGWVGNYWQNPENNWGSKDGGFNLSKAEKLTFWAKGENGEERLEFKAGGITGAYADSDIATLGPIELTDEWQKYTISLKGYDFSYISGGFVWAVSRMDNPYGFIIYLDDIIYE